MKVLNILSCGGVGGVENLCKDYGIYSKHENHFIVLWYPGKISEEMLKLGVPVIVFDTKPSRYLMDLLKLKNYIKKNAFDVLIVHQVAILTSIYILFIKRWFPELKILTYVHSNANDWSSKGFRGKIDMIMKKNTYRNSVKTVCISESVKQSVIDVLGVNEEKLVVIYNGVDCSRFYDSKNKKVYSNECLEIIYVGRLERCKGVQNILYGLSKTNVPYIFRIVGDGNYKKELEVLSGRLGITDNVYFLGTRRDVPSLLCQSGIFIHMPDCQEGFGITVVEAMSAGCLCIVNDHGALPEIVEEGVSGFVIHNEKEFPKIINDIWMRRSEMHTEGEMLYKIRENAVLRAEKYNIDTFSKKLDIEVEKLCR